MQKGGIGKFKASFNEYQAAYFSQHSIDDKRALLADNTFYAFNDYLQWAIETGIAGTALLAFTIYLVLQRILYLYRKNIVTNLLVSVSASLICVSAAAMFSYPLQAFPVQAFALICLGIVTFYPTKGGFAAMKQKLSFCILPIVVAFLFFTCVVNEWNAGKRKQLEREASELTRSGYKVAALEKYSELVRKHPAYGYGWILYSRQLYYFNRIEEARENLREGMNYFVDNMAYKLKADIEKALGDYAGAEKSYLHAIYMVPNRMGSRFNLLNFYAAENDTAKIIFWGISILKMPVKVVSEKTDILLLQTRSVIEKVTR